MVVKSSFFNSLNGDRRYDAGRFAEYFASFIGNGVFVNPSTSLQVIEKQNLTISVKPGKGWINGYYVVNDSDFDLTLDNADGLLSRVDRIILQLDMVKREINILIKKGVFSSNPTGINLRRDAEIYELALAEILIRNGSVSITQAEITDTRLNNALCGSVHGVVDQLDTTTLFNQYQSWISQQESIYENDFLVWSEQRREEFQQFIEDLNAMLDGDVAANLSNRINQTNNNLTQLQQQFNTHLAEDNDTAHAIQNIAGLETALNNKANLIGGKVPLEELPEISEWQESSMRLSSASARIDITNIDAQEVIIDFSSPSTISATANPMRITVNDLLENYVNANVRPSNPPSGSVSTANRYFEGINLNIVKEDIIRVIVVPNLGCYIDSLGKTINTQRINLGILDDEGLLRINKISISNSGGNFPVGTSVKIRKRG